jgi:hypothetical protein
MTTLTEYFSPNYATAKRRFIEAAVRAGFEHHLLPVCGAGPDEEPLTIDIAVAGMPRPESALVLSSGLHGVEGFFGSAVQLAFLDSLGENWQPPPNVDVILLHALNPFGFAWRRRFNEENVDLNRNFLVDQQVYAGAPPLTSAFHRVLAPGRWTSRRGLSTMGIGYLAARHGLGAFWETLPVGQYEHADWLCFGGRGRSQCAELLESFLPPRLASASEVIHLDYHTGLGRWGVGELLLPEADSAGNVDWWKSHFDPAKVRGSLAGQRAYDIRGGLGEWLQARFPDCHYRFATAEFGTYSPFRMLKALVDELRVYTKSSVQSPDHPSRRRLSDAFVPPQPAWREKTLGIGLELAQRSLHILASEHDSSPQPDDVGATSERL